MTVGASVALHSHGAHVRQQHHRALPDLVVEPGGGELLPGDGVGGPQHTQVLGRHLADDANAQPRPGEGLTGDDLLRHAQLAADGAHLVLEQLAQRLDELEVEVLGQAAHVVVALDVGGALSPAGLDDVGIQGPLDQEADLAALSTDGLDDPALGGLEGADELPADDLALGLRLGDAGQGAQEALGLVDRDDADAHALGVVVLDLLALAGAQQAVVDEDAGELVADGAVDEGGGHGGVHSPAQAADDVGVAHLLADAGHLLVDDVVRRPGGRQSRLLVQEVDQGGLPMLGVEDLGVPLQPVEAAARVLEGGHRRLGGGGGDGEALGGGLDRVTVTHPHHLVVRGTVE